MISIAIISLLIIIILGHQRWILVFCTFPCLVLGTALVNIKGNNIISTISETSSNLYVWHYPLMLLFQVILDAFELNIIHTYMTMLSFLIISWFIATIIRKYIEKPLNKLIRR